MCQTWAASNRQKCQQPKKTQWSAASSSNWSFLQWTTRTALTPINYVRFTSQISTCPLNSEGTLLIMTTTYRNIQWSFQWRAERTSPPNDMLRAQSVLLCRITSKVIFYSTFFYFCHFIFKEHQCTFLICNFQLVSVKADKCFSFNKCTRYVWTCRLVFVL